MKYNGRGSYIITICQAVTYFADADKLAEISEDLGQAMVGINCNEEKESWEGGESGGK